jgi:hypothetical protein
VSVTASRAAAVVTARVHTAYRWRLQVAAPFSMTMIDAAITWDGALWAHAAAMEARMAVAVDPSAVAEGVVVAWVRAAAPPG